MSLCCCCCKKYIPPNTSDKIYFPFSMRKVEFDIRANLDFRTVTERLPLRVLTDFFIDLNWVIVYERRRIKRTYWYVLIYVILIIIDLLTAVVQGTYLFFILVFVLALLLCF